MCMCIWINSCTDVVAMRAQISADQCMCVCADSLAQAVAAAPAIQSVSLCICRQFRCHIQHIASSTCYGSLSAAKCTFKCGSVRRRARVKLPESSSIWRAPTLGLAERPISRAQWERQRQFFCAFDV